MKVKEILMRKIELNAELRELDMRLNDVALNLSPEVIQAWDEGIIKFNFPILPWVKAELKNKLK